MVRHPIKSEIVRLTPRDRRPAGTSPALERFQPRTREQAMTQAIGDYLADRITDEEARRLFMAFDETAEQATDRLLGLDRMKRQKRIDSQLWHATDDAGRPTAVFGYELKSKIRANYTITGPFTPEETARFWREQDVFAAGLQPGEVE